MTDASLLALDWALRGGTVALNIAVVPPAVAVL